MLKLQLMHLTAWGCIALHLVVDTKASVYQYIHACTNDSSIVWYRLSLVQRPATGMAIARRAMAAMRRFSGQGRVFGVMA